jgi:hypothetical protein
MTRNVDEIKDGKQQYTRTMNIFVQVLSFDILEETSLHSKNLAMMINDNTSFFER